jgi:uncharacterized protein YsxB (DUF464 family)
VITLKVRRKNGHIIRFELWGHAGYAEAGQDIVCAGVSALVIAAANGLITHAGVSRIVRQGNGRFTCLVRDIPSERARDMADAVLGTMVSGVAAIAARHPENVVLID